MTTLNPADKKDANVVLSNGNLTVTGNGASNNWVRSTTARAGKQYLEITTTTIANTVIGIADLTTMTFPGANAKSFGMFSSSAGSINGTFPTWGPTYASGNVLCMAVDFTAKKVWFRVGAAGQWNGNTASHNPATGLGGWDISLYTGAANYLIVSGDNTTKSTVNFGSSAFTGAIPSGFSAWDATATFAATEGADTAALSVTVSQALALNATEGADTAAFSVTASQPLSFALTEGADTAAFSVDVSSVTELPAFQQNAFQYGAFQMDYDEILFGMVEGADVAAFTTTSTTLATFALVEGPDTYDTHITVRTFIQLPLVEGPDVLAFNLDVKTFVTFGVTEGKDLYSGTVLTGARFSFALVEGADVPNFRTFGTFWSEGDADYIYAPYENQTITIPGSLTPDATTYIVVAAEKQTIIVPEQIDVIGIRAEDRDANLQDEWQRIDVDQHGARRREPV